MTECHPNGTPTALVPLGSDPEGEAMDETWSYHSVVGMLLYLSTNTRPDIAFAVSQVARFSSAPKKSHATAVKTLIRYLKGTMHIGTIMKPTKDLDIECYVDADFAGLNSVEPQSDPVRAKSRTGYIIKVAGCPAIWKSQLQTSIATSTGHAEYIALSSAMRQVIPMKRMLTEALSVMRPTMIPPVPVIRATVFEDNSAALSLATNHRLNNRTHFFNTSLHHFWEAVKNEEVRNEKIETNEQQADYFTKPLPKEPFVANRMNVQCA